MSVTHLQGEVTVKPTPIYWVIGGTLSFALPGFGILIAIFCFAMASGKLVNVQLSNKSLTITQFGVKRFYKWSEFKSFEVKHASKNKAMLGHLSNPVRGLFVKKIIYIPIVGTTPKNMLEMCEAYRQGKSADVIASLPETARSIASGARGETLATLAKGSADKAMQPKKQPIPVAQKRLSRRQAPIRPRQSLPAKRRIPKGATPLVQERFKIFARRPRGLGH